MYNPFGGNKFPYTNFHELNLDWIIEIAKNFLDQYTNIQETIDTGLDDLDSKATELENLLQAWYDEHSEDIADQLASALSDLNDWYTTHEGYLDQYVTDSIAAFQEAADTKAAQTLATIPDDYTALSDQVTLIREAGEEYIPGLCEPKLLTNQWVIGNLNSSGIISTGSRRRISTLNYLKSKNNIQLIDYSRTLIFIVCTYADDKTLINRSSTINIPANTFFKVTAYGDESADLDDARELSKYVGYTDSDYIREENNAMKIASTLKVMSQAGLDPLPSNFTIGNLYSDGNIRYNTRSRIVFTDYMSFSHKVAIQKESSDYAMILCTYNADYTLANRSVYTTYNTAHINANTLFRIAMYNINDDLGGVELTDPFDLVKRIGIPSPASVMSLDSDFIALFESFAVVGDSLSAGFVSDGIGSSYTSNQARIAGRNWPTYLGLKINRTFTNLSRGSSSAHDWRYGNAELDVDISTANINTYCYMLAIGINDLRNMRTVGTPSDIALSMDSNEDTFYGNYDWIVRKLIEYKTARISQAKIFVFTIPATESTAETYNAAIRYVASLYQDVYCIDLYNLYYNEVLEDTFQAVWVGRHSRPLGYMLMSDMIRTAVNRYMVENESEFSYTPWAPLT